MEKKYYIYCYENKLNGMKYVGRTCKTLKSRAGRGGRNYYRVPKFREAILEFGWENFEPTILEQTTDKELSYELEKKWIREKNSILNGYNSSIGGKSCEGCHWNLSSETRNKISESRKGIVFSDETRARMSESAKKKVLTQEHKDNISKSVRGKFVNRPDQSKRILQYTKDGQFVAEYPSIAEANRAFGNKGGISHCLRGKSKSACGFVWRYADTN